MTVDRMGEVVVARLGRRYDAFHEAESAEFEQQLTAAVADSPSPRVVLDLSKTEYFSSATIESLFRVWRKMEAKGSAKMALAGATSFCKEIIETARLDNLWPLHADVDSAVASMSG